MKIIYKPGKTNRIECSCKCIFEYDKEDIHNHYPDGWDSDDNKSYNYVRCPHCGRIHIIYD